MQRAGQQEVNRAVAMPTKTDMGASFAMHDHNSAGDAGTIIVKQEISYLMNGNSVLRSHLVKLIDTDDPIVSQHHGAPLYTSFHI